MDKKNNDSMGYLDSIKKALPKSQIKEVNNYDDLNFGWDISPVPGVLIVFMVSIDDHMRLSINRYHMNTYENTLIHASMFHGQIPANDNQEPDYSFIEQLLKNYDSIG